MGSTPSAGSAARVRAPQPGHARRTHRRQQRGRCSTTWSTCSAGSRRRKCPGWPGWPPRFRPLFGLPGRRVPGGSAEGGREEFVESRTRRALNSRTSASSATTRASRARITARTAGESTSPAAPNCSISEADAAALASEIDKAVWERDAPQAPCGCRCATRAWIPRRCYLSRGFGFRATERIQCPHT